jgi:hypothetical protein
MENSFEEANRVRCFNHTTHLSAKAFLKPFNVAISGKDDDEIADGDDGDGDGDGDEEDTDGDDGGEESEGEDEDLDVDMEDDADPFDALSEAERDELLEETAAVRDTVSKVRASSFLSIKYLLTFCADPQAFLCHHTINYDCSSCLAKGVQGIKSQVKAYPA